MFLYVALGDSITAGASASGPEYTYPNRVIEQLASPAQPAFNATLAQPGWTSAILEQAVIDNPNDLLARAQAVSVWIGGDDLAYAGLAVAQGAPRSIIERSLRNYALHLGRMVSFIQSSGARRIVVCTQYNPFPNSPLAIEGIRGLNGLTTRVASQTHTLLAPVHLWFAGREPELISGYKTGRLEDALSGAHLPIHPNNRGHAVIATGLLQLVSH